MNEARLRAVVHHGHEAAFAPRRCAFALTEVACLLYFASSEDPIMHPRLPAMRALPPCRAQGGAALGAPSIHRNPVILGLSPAAPVRSR
jgi:hypothetical protein